MVAEKCPPPPVDSAGTSSNGRRRAASVPPCAWAGTAGGTITRTEDRSTTTLALLISHLLMVGSLERELKRGQYSRAVCDILPDCSYAEADHHLRADAAAAGPGRPRLPLAVRGPARRDPGGAAAPRSAAAGHARPRPATRLVAGDDRQRLRAAPVGGLSERPAAPGGMAGDLDHRSRPPHRGLAARRRL